MLFVRVVVAFLGPWALYLYIAARTSMAISLEWDTIVLLRLLSDID